MRKIAKTKRELIPKYQKLYYDTLILRNVKKILALLNFNNIFIYLSMPSEVDTSKIIDFLISKGKNIYVPKIVEKQEMIAVEYKKGDLMKKNKFGIEEPEKSCYIDPQCIDICIIPIVAFDRELNRLGFGKGFYDRFLCKVRNDCIKIGIAYQCQMVDMIKPEDHDVELDIIVTERFIYGDLYKNCRGEANEENFT